MKEELNIEDKELMKESNKVLKIVLIAVVALLIIMWLLGL